MWVLTSGTMRAQGSEGRDKKGQESSSDFSGARAPVHELSGSTEGCPEIVLLVAHPRPGCLLVFCVPH